MTTKKEKESLPATEDFTFKICGIVKAVIPCEYVGQNQTEMRGLVISQKSGDPERKYHPTVFVTYRGDKGVAIDNSGGIDVGDEIETTYTPTCRKYQKDGIDNYIQSNSGRSITIINKASSLFAQSAEDDLPF